MHKLQNINPIKTLFLFFTFIFNSIYTEGFLSGTLVKTPYDYRPIETLNVNDRVISYDFKNAQLVNGIISQIHHKKEI